MLVTLRLHQSQEWTAIGLHQDCYSIRKCRSFRYFKREVKIFPGSRTDGRPMSTIAHSKELVVVSQTVCRTTALDAECSFR